MFSEDQTKSTLSLTKKTDQRELVGFGERTESVQLRFGTEHFESFGSAVGVAPLVVVP